MSRTGAARAHSGFPDWLASNPVFPVGDGRRGRRVFFCGSGAKGETRTLTPFRRQNLNLVRLPIPPLSRCPHSNIMPPRRHPESAAPQARMQTQLPLKSMAVNHYENFPVASVLLPAHLRRPVALIYAFARQADDFADEGDRPASVRLASLAGWVRQLDLIESGVTPSAPLFVDLAAIIQEFDLPIDLFRDLLSAFSQDVVK